MGELYVSRLFKESEDQYDEDRWKGLWDNLELGGDSGFIHCDECGSQVHVYSASRDNPGYNEQLEAYVTFADRVVICGPCMADAFECLSPDLEGIMTID